MRAAEFDGGEAFDNGEVTNGRGRRSADAGACTYFADNAAVHITVAGRVHIASVQRRPHIADGGRHFDVADKRNGLRITGEERWHLDLADARASWYVIGDAFIHIAN